MKTTIEANQPAGRLLTPQQAAQIAGLSDHSLANMRCSGRGPAFFKVGRYVRYDEHDLHQWMRSRRYTSTSEASAVA